MHVSGQSATTRSSVTGNMHLIGVRYFFYRYHVQCDPALKKLMLVGFGKRSSLFVVSICYTMNLNKNTTKEMRK